MITKYGIGAVALVGLGLLTGAGCDGDVDRPAVESADAPLAVGSTGARVAQVHEFLTRYGYFENATLRKFYPGWQPVVGQLPARPDVYDEATREGVLAYQKLIGLSQTGIVDTATAKKMAEPRCSFPDVDPDRLDATQKFAVSSAKWPGRTVTYRYENYPDIGASRTQAWIRDAFAQWAAASFLSFQAKSTNEDAQIVMEWVPNYANLGIPAPIGSDNPLQKGDMARAFMPTDGRIFFDSMLDWGGITENNLYLVAMHEIGHALGLHHSSVWNKDGTSPVMHPNYGNIPYALTRDDQQAIGAKYSEWAQMPGKARDISAANYGYVWGISDVPLGSNGYKVMLWEPGDEAGWYWDQYGGVGVKIAAAAPGPSTNCFVVNASGQLWERNPTKCGTRGWCQWATPVPAIDVGYLGSAGVPMIVGNNNVLYVHSGGLFVPVMGAPPTKKVAAGPILGNTLSDGIWVVRSTDNKVFRRVPLANSTIPFAWTEMPGTLIDVAAGRDGSVWGIGTSANGSGGNGIYIWNYQQGSSASDVPSANRWLKVNNGAGTDITVDDQGIPWVINSARDVFKRRRD